MTKADLQAVIAQKQAELIALSDFIHAHPEEGNEEFLAYAKVVDWLKSNGFDVEEAVLGLKTAFKATRNVRGGGVKIGLLCEYDALKGLGHACAHNLQSPAILGAALALAECLEVPATILVYGTPAEETTSGKLVMTQAGLFDELDLVFMMHGSDSTTVDEKSLALNLIDFIYEGKPAHAAIAPEKGISALDAVLMLFNGMEYLREHVRSDVRFHGVITDGGKAANIVPARAAAQFYVRANDRPHLNEVLKRVMNVAEAAALATGAKLTVQEVKAYDNKLNVPTLNKLLLDNAAACGAPDITPPRKQTGSTDFSSVTYRVPGACLRVGIVKPGVASHTEAFREAAGDERGRQAILLAAKAIAACAWDVATDPALLTAIKTEFVEAKKASQ